MVIHSVISLVSGFSQVRLNCRITGQISLHCRETHFCLLTLRPPPPMGLLRKSIRQWPQGLPIIPDPTLMTQSESIVVISMKIQCQRAGLSLESSLSSFLAYAYSPVISEDLIDIWHLYWAQVLLFSTSNCRVHLPATEAFAK